MDITVRGKHIEVPDSVVEHAQRKLSRLDHYLPLLSDATVEVDLAHERAKEPGGRYVIHVSVNGGGVHLRAEEHAAQPEAAIDQAAHVLAEQARRHKERLYGRGRTREPKQGEQRLATPPDADGTGDDSDLPPRVAEVQRMPVKPMSTAEAVEQMDTLGHNIFIFLDTDIEQFAVLYRRDAGDYALIIPELS
ncbi:MAG: ribosome-associated translation inhibitor RaiA [Dehalococcoidia bacterium]